MSNRQLRNAGIAGIALTGMIIAGQVTASTLSIVDASNIASSNITVTVGDTFSIFVRATEMPETGSGSVNLDWTDGILQLDSWVVLAPYDDISLGAPTVTSNSITALNGGVLFEAPLSGDFNFAQLGFTALNPTGTPINLTAIESASGWTTYTGSVINFDNVFGATVTVTEVPLPAPALLFGAGLLGLMVIARRRMT